MANAENASKTYLRKSNPGNPAGKKVIATPGLKISLPTEASQEIIIPASFSL
jgi:hypothetical protein